MQVVVVAYLGRDTTQTIEAILRAITYGTSGKPKAAVLVIFFERLRHLNQDVTIDARFERSSNGCRSQMRATPSGAPQRITPLKRTWS